MAVILRSEQEELYKKLGFEGAALESLLKDGAKQRHLSRVEFAYQKCRDYSQAQLEAQPQGYVVSAQDLNLGGLAICLSDMFGVSGREGLGCAERHPAFRSCGKGHKRAGDTAHWNAAIKEASDRFEEWLVELNGVAKTPMFYATQLGFIRFGLVDPGSKRDPALPERIVASRVVPANWVLHIAREGLRIDAGTPGVYPGLRERVRPGNWAAAVNRWATEIEAAKGGDVEEDDVDQ